MSRTSTTLPSVSPTARQSPDGELMVPPTPAVRDTPDIALASFQKIVTNEANAGEQGEFGFKALKQMTKLTFKLGRYGEALAYYKTLLTYTKKGVTRNVAEKSINGILDYVSAQSALETERMQEFYEVTMSALEEAKNDVSIIPDVARDAGLTRIGLVATEYEDESQTRKTVVGSQGVPPSEQG